MGALHGIGKDECGEDVPSVEESGARTPAMSSAIEAGEEI
jgi:hypothetical protein